MKPRQKSTPVSSRKVDMQPFIESQEALHGAAALGDLPRLAHSLAPEVALPDMAAVAWQATGRLVAQRVGPPQLWLDLAAQATLPWTCQRCLGPVMLPVVVERALRFVADEAVAAQLDAELDDDVLVLSRSFDLLELIEDELIMAAPLVPRHETCPQPVVMSVSDPGVDEPELDADGAVASDKPNPFAVLAALKKDQSGSGDAG